MPLVFGGSSLCVINQLDWGRTPGVKEEPEPGA